MNYLIHLAIIVIISTLLNSVYGEITLDFNVTWNKCGGSNSIEYAKVTGKFPSNLTCSTTAIMSFDVNLNLKPVGGPEQITVIRVHKVWFVGNKGYFSYGPVTSGLCAGGAYVSVGIYKNQDLKACKKDCGITKQSTSVSLIVISGGGCGDLNACEGVTIMKYSPPLTF